MNIIIIFKQNTLAKANRPSLMAILARPYGFSLYTIIINIFTSYSMDSLLIWSTYASASIYACVCVWYLFIINYYFYMIRFFFFHYSLAFNKNFYTVLYMNLNIKYINGKNRNYNNSKYEYVNGASFSFNSNLLVCCKCNIHFNLKWQT